MTIQPSHSVQYFTMTDGSKRAYQRLEASTTSQPGLIFLSGHGSDMFGTKAEAITDFAKSRGLGFLRFDYFGHGLSDGTLETGTISRWVEDACVMLDNLTHGPQIVIGSSLGGWIMLRLAQERSNRIAGLVGIAAAPDFTETLIWQSLSEKQKQKMKQDGFIAQDNPYSDEDVIYTYELVCDGRTNLVLNTPLTIAAPVHLHQGMKDAEVPYHTALDIVQNLTSDRVTLHLDKRADHRYSEPDQIAAILGSISTLLERDS